MTLPKIQHLETRGFYDLMLDGVFLFEGKLAVGIIDPHYTDVKLRMEDGEVVLDEDGDEVYDYPPVVYHLHALTPEDWVMEAASSREYWAWRSDNDVHTSEAKAYYDKWLDWNRDRDYSGCPIVGKVAYENIKWTKDMHFFERQVPDWFDQNYEQHDPRDY